MSHQQLLIIFSIIMLPGMAGVWLPFVPGLPYMFVVALIYAGLDDFQHLTGTELLILGAVALLSVVVDYLSGLLGAKIGGAAKQSLWYGFAGLVLGMIIVPPLGGVAGLFLGVLIGELQRRKTKEYAIKAATGSVIGSLGAIVINIILALVFFGLFIGFALRQTP